MNKGLTIFLLLVSLFSCASSSKSANNSLDAEVIEEILDQAEANSSPEGRKILETSRSMISNQEILVGGCWNYVNAVYERAGFASRKQKATIFKSKFKGPYLTSESIETGDWLYFVNHTYSDTEHSAIFVAWIDEEAKVALTVSYAGGNQKKPATYKRFTLNNVYNVIRPQD